MLRSLKVLSAIEKVFVNSSKSMLLAYSLGTVQSRVKCLFIQEKAKNLDKNKKQNL